MAGGLSLKGLGGDMISFDEMNSTTMDVHKMFLAKDMILVENLTELAPLTGREFVFSCLPLKICRRRRLARQSGRPHSKSVPGLTRYPILNRDSMFDLNMLSGPSLLPEHLKSGSGLIKITDFHEFYRAGYRGSVCPS